MKIWPTFMKFSMAPFATSRSEVPKYVRWFIDAEVSTRKMMIVILKLTFQSIFRPKILHKNLANSLRNYSNTSCLFPAASTTALFDSSHATTTCHVVAPPFFVHWSVSIKGLFSISMNNSIDPHESSFEKCINAQNMQSFILQRTFMCFRRINVVYGNYLYC